MNKNYSEFFSTPSELNFSSLFLNYCGHEKCTSSHSYGPAVRSQYLIHFILNGKGSFFCEKKKYDLHKDEMFLIRPGITTYYYAADEDPWEYAWIAFSGTDSEKIIEDCGFGESPVCHINDSALIMDAIKKIITNIHQASGNMYYILSMLYQIFFCLSRNTNVHDKNYNSEVVNNAIKQIKNHYNDSINIQLLSQKLGVDRTYLYKLFKKEVGLSPKQYLIKYRLQQAATLLNSTNNSIKCISECCGFPSATEFSTSFKSQMGSSPQEFRKNYVNNEKT